MTDAPERFRRMTTVYLARTADITNHPQSAMRTVTVAHADVQQRGIRVRFAEVTDRTTAETLVGLLLMVDKPHRIRLPKGTYFVDDLIGMAVDDDQGEHLGELREVLHMPAHDVYVVDAAGKELMIPAVKEFILSVDVPARRMRVKLIEGMKE